MATRPKDMTLRCLAHPTKRGTWVAKCLDLDLVTEEASLDAARQDLRAMIESYVATVLDTEDRDRIPVLLPRKGPWYDRLRFCLLSLSRGRLGKGRGQCMVFRHELHLPMGPAPKP